MPAHREAGEVGVSQRDRARCAKPPNVRGIEHRKCGLQHLETRARRRAEQIDARLDGERHAVQWRKLGPRCDGAVRFLGCFQSLLFEQNRDRVDRGVQLSYPREMRAHDCRRCIGRSR
jgi:hypothetical protein